MPIATPVTNTFTPVPVGTPTQVAPVTVDPGQLATPEAVTSEQRLAGILNKGGALMQQAATTGNQQAASRGLLNSSMGVQAAQAAVLDKALPMATNDAATLNSMSTYNASTLNQNATQNAQTQNQSNQFNAQNENQFKQTDAQNANVANQWNAGQQNEATLKAMDMNSREQLAGIEANYKSLMQANSSAEGMYSQVMKNISDIQMSDTVADKQTAINSQLAWLNSGMQMISNMNGISGLVTFT